MLACPPSGIGLEGEEEGVCGAKNLLLHRPTYLCNHLKAIKRKYLGVFALSCVRFVQEIKHDDYRLCHQLSSFMTLK